MWKRVLPLFMAVVGTVWLLQGTGHIRGSAMTDQPIWAIAGALLLMLAALLVWTARSRGTRT